MAIQQLLLAEAIASGGGGASRYWRINVTANGGNAYCSMQEAELRATLGGSDITVPTMTCADSSHFGSRIGKQLFNDIIGTDADNGWTSNATSTGWVSIDLGSVQSVAQVAIWPEPTSGLTNTRSPTAFDIQTSPDNATWTTVKSFSAFGAWTAGTPKTFNL